MKHTTRATPQRTVGGHARYCGLCKRNVYTSGGKFITHHVTALWSTLAPSDKCDGSNRTPDETAELAKAKAVQA